MTLPHTVQSSPLHSRATIRTEPQQPINQSNQKPGTYVTQSSPVRTTHAKINSRPAKPFANNPSLSVYKQHHGFIGMLITPLLNKDKQSNNMYIHSMIYRPTHFPSKNLFGKPKWSSNCLIEKLFMKPLCLKMLLAKASQNSLTKFTNIMHRLPGFSR